MITTPDYQALLQTAIAEARQGLAEGGVPIGAARATTTAACSAAATTAACRKATRRCMGNRRLPGRRQRRYQDTIMVTTLAPCWYCSGLVRQFNIGTVVVGESRTFQGGIDWLRENGVNVIDLDNQECVDLLGDFISRHPDIWNEDIGE